MHSFSINKSSGLSNLSAIISPTSTKASSLKPLVVKAAVPNLKPLVTKGDSGSNGTVFLFAVMLTSLTSKSATLPVILILLKSSKTI